MGSPMYKIVLGMSYYIHFGGPGALVGRSQRPGRRSLPPLAALARDQHSQTSVSIGTIDAIAFECVVQPDKRCTAGVSEHFP